MTVNGVRFRSKILVELNSAPSKVEGSVADSI